MSVAAVAIVAAGLAVVIDPGLGASLLPYDALARGWVLHPSDASALPAGARVETTRSADIDGDGRVDELRFVEYPTPSEHLQRLELRRGDRGRLLLENPHDEFQWDRHASATLLGDFDGDGARDVAVGSTEFNHEPRRYGRISLEDAGWGSDDDSGGVWVFSGTDGTLLLTVFGRESHGGFGTRVAGLDDVNGDGLDEVVAWDDGGRAYVFPGVRR